MAGNPIKELDDKAKELGEKVLENQGLLCKVLYSEARKDPTASAALDVMKWDLSRDVVKQVVPGVRAYAITKDISQRAHDKLGKSDYLGAAADYSAVVALGLTSATPFAIGSDLTQEFLRAAGVDVPHSPVVNAYNTVSGLYKVCSVAEERLQPYVKAKQQKEALHAGNKAPLPEPKELFAEVDLTEAQREAVNQLAKRAQVALETTLKEEPKAPPKVASIPYTRTR